MLCCAKRGAEDGTRTHDLLVTNELLYQLSYFGKNTLWIRRRRLHSGHEIRCNYSKERLQLLAPLVKCVEGGTRALNGCLIFN